MLKVVVSVCILMVVVAIYSLLAFLSEKRSNCVEGAKQICGSDEGGEGGCCGNRRV